ncbi:ABC transporter permease [Candidatus Aerophobetes bacterium Ae_b3b]|nr:MAG: ABC transporter permease [Candidatus Aerophobetes bacterium Ae_b3b]
MILSSFKPSELFGTKQIYFIFKPTLENYKFIFHQYPFLSYLRNSLVVTFTSTFLSIVFGSLAGYSLARFKTGGEPLAFWVLSTRMLPPAAVIIPFFMIYMRAGLINTLFGLIIAYMVFNLSFVVWMTRSFFGEIPVELEEAAMLDGCSRLGAFIRVVLPLAKNGIAATAVFCVVFAWNEFLFALVLTTSEAAQTLPASVNRFITKYEIHWGPLYAESTLIIFPILIAALFMQRYLVRGLTLGALKG